MATGIVGMEGLWCRSWCQPIDGGARKVHARSAPWGFRHLSVIGLMPVLPWAAVVILIVILLVWKAKAARIEGHCIGRTP